MALNRITIYAALAILYVVLCVARPLYPVAGTWMKDRYTRKQWDEALDKFGRQGGSIVWQRGRPFRPIEPIDIIRDPDYAWCYINGTTCVEAMQNKLADLGLKIANYLFYDYNEGYSDAVLLCPELDVFINTSRLYWLLVLPVNYTEDVSDECSSIFTEGSVNLAFMSFDGIDSKSLLLDAADDRGFSVYLGMPGLPPADLAPWTINPSLMGSFQAFVRRVFLDYKRRHGNHPSFAGVYQSLELSLSVDVATELFGAYELITTLVKQYLPPGKNRFVVSPYIDANLSQVNATLDDHVENFISLALTGVDVIAIQEGRGVAKSCYFWPHQQHTEITLVDPGCLAIVQYLDPRVPSDVTFGEQFTVSIQQLFAAFAETQQQLIAKSGLNFELWANLEAFEYLRNAPCLPVDDIGNAMAERLDRTWKARIDWGLTNEGALVNNIISFAWDSDYLCRDGGYDKSLTDEIVEDADRPVVSMATFVTQNISDGNVPLQILGFAIAPDDRAGVVEFWLEWMTSTGELRNQSFASVEVDPDYGMNNHRSPVLQAATVLFPETDYAELKTGGYLNILPWNRQTGKLAYHVWSYYY